MLRLLGINHQPTHLLLPGMSKHPINNFHESLLFIYLVFTVNYNFYSLFYVVNWRQNLPRIFFLSIQLNDLFMSRPMATKCGKTLLVPLYMIRLSGVYNVAREATTFIRRDTTALE